MLDLQHRLDEQQRYYRRRAGDFHDWMTDYTEPVRTELMAALRSEPLTGDVLELAAGTGYWTQELCDRARSVTAVDGAPEMAAVLRGRALADVTVLERDLFTWVPDRRWDAIFFAHWLAHVPAERLEAFWAMLEATLAPGGRVVIVDVTHEERAIERRFWSEAEIDFVQRETLDGERFAVVKHYWEPDALLARLRAWGWEGTATPIGRDDGRGFVVYSVGRAEEAIA